MMNHLKCFQMLSFLIVLIISQKIQGQSYVNEYGQDCVCHPPGVPALSAPAPEVNTSPQFSAGQQGVQYGAVAPPGYPTSGIGIPGDMQSGMHENTQGGYYGTPNGGIPGSNSLQGAMYGDMQGGMQGNTQGSYYGTPNGGILGGNSFPGAMQGGAMNGNIQGGMQGTTQGGYYGTPNGGIPGSNGLQGAMQGGAMNGNMQGGASYLGGMDVGISGTYPGSMQVGSALAPGGIASAGIGMLPVAPAVTVSGTRVAEQYDQNGATIAARGDQYLAAHGIGQGGIRVAEQYDQNGASIAARGDSYLAAPGIALGGTRVAEQYDQNGATIAARVDPFIGRKTAIKIDETTSHQEDTAHTDHHGNTSKTHSKDHTPKHRRKSLLPLDNDEHEEIIIPSSPFLGPIGPNSINSEVRHHFPVFADLAVNPKKDPKMLKEYFKVFEKMNLDVDDCKHSKDNE